MDDVRDLAFVDDALERRQVGDVALHMDDGGGLIIVERERHAVPIVADVERDDGVAALEQASDRPDADGAERSRDEEPAVAHS